MVSPARTPSTDIALISTRFDMILLGPPDVKPLEQFYPRPGKKNVAVRLGVIPAEGGETVWLDWDRKEYEYLAAVSWGAVKADPKGRLTVQLQERTQHATQLSLVDSVTGKLRVDKGRAAPDDDRRAALADHAGVQ